MHKLVDRLKLSSVVLIGVCCVSSSSFAEMSEKAANKLAEFERTGETVQCLRTTSIRSMKALDDYHFLVRTNGNKYYLNETHNRCNRASHATTRIQYKLHGVAQLCKHQIIKIVDNSSGISTGSCGLSSFERLNKIPEATE